MNELTATEELGHQITRCIADAVTDVLAHVASYCGEQAREEGRITLPWPDVPGAPPLDAVFQAWRDGYALGRDDEAAGLPARAERPTGEPRPPGPEHGIRWLTGRVRQLENALGEAVGRFAFPPDVTLEARATAGVQQLGYWKMILRGEPEPTRLRPETEMWRDLVEDVGIDRANRDWPKLDPRRGGPGYNRKP